MSSSSYQALIDRFAGLCRSDTRVTAAFVGGSRGRCTADEHADVDLYLILRDEAYDDFFAGRRDFMSKLGEPAFLEDFDGFGHDMLLFIYADGVEGELMLMRASGFEQIPSGPFQALVDKPGILPSQPFPPIKQPAEPEQREQLRWIVYWFWRDLSQLSRWLARGRLWTAYGHLEMMRHTCLNLARLKHDFAVSTESYYKLEHAADPEDLAAFQRSFCQVEREALLKAVRSLLEIYLRVAPPLAAAHGIPYPSGLQHVVIRRLEQASGTSFEAMAGG